ncbi:prickle planar cell polarity protein 3-A [Lepeophtheirus salmonis]|nr:prickle planar cell polarity protein 3-A-like [Lepeophtheirus salmonis]
MRRSKNCSTSSNYSTTTSYKPSLEEEGTSLPPPPRLIPPILTLSTPSCSSSVTNTIPIYSDPSSVHCIKCKNCVGFVSHSWRNACSLCKCSRAFHREDINNTTTRFLSLDEHGEEEIGKKTFTTQRIPMMNNTSSHTISSSSNTSGGGGYAWCPSGLTTGQIEDYMRELPPEKVPKCGGSSGEKYREEQLSLQCPKQDFALKYTRHVEPGLETSSYIDFIAARNNLALDVGKALEISSLKSQTLPECGKCGNLVQGIGILATRLGLDSFWHPSCFTCSTCDELLVDLKYCINLDKLFCERHYAENFKPRCSACDELIFSGQYTKALGKDWHCHHFCCWHCDANLTGNRYVLTGKGTTAPHTHSSSTSTTPTNNHQPLPSSRNIFSLTDDHPCCLSCFEQNFTHVCINCEKVIGLDSKDMSYKDNHWHEGCFVCGKCRITLVDSPFAAKESRIFCGPCYDAEFAARCDACGETFKIGHRKMEYKTRKWHDRCFKCVSCSAEVGSHSFIIPNEKDVYCLPCFEDKFATKCNKCKKIMTTGGVTFKNEAWHRECFVCCNCNTTLTGQKFASRNDKPYCADCFGELFAKRCTACCKPITGAGGTRFISFEGRHWHSHCFICALCKVSMAGKGFITDGEDIICPDCAKEKLMGGTGAVPAPSSA